MILYTALILDEQSHKALLAWFEQVSGKPLLDKVLAHHVTIIFKPTAGQVANTDIGAKASVHVIGWAADAQTQAVAVAGLDVASGVPHVTISCAQGTSPVRSLALLQEDSNFWRVGPTLTGRIEAVSN